MDGNKTMGLDDESFSGTEKFRSTMDTKGAKVVKKKIISPTKRVSFHEKIDHDENAEEDTKSPEGYQSKPSELVNRESEVKKKAGENSSSAAQESPIISVPFVCLSDGLARKATPFDLSSWVALSLTLDGRDKITKTIQYACRLISWWYATVLSSSKAATPYTNLYKSLSNSRKAFRLGRFLVEYYKLKQTIPQLFSNYRRPNMSSAGISSLFHRTLEYLCIGLYKEKALSSNADATPLWSTIGVSCKMIALAGFWFGDNVTYLASSGFLPPKEIYTKKAQFFSARSYFFGALIGLYVAWRDIKVHQPTLIDATKRVHDLVSEEEEEEKEESYSPALHSSKWKVALDALSVARSKQFVLFLALLKSTCDALVFSNNPGVDLHLRFRGKKMNEGFHCLCGLLSAGTVLYNNFPEKKQQDLKEKSTEERKAAFRRSASSNWYPSPSSVLL